MVTISECRTQCNLLHDEIEHDPWFQQTIPAAVSFLSNTINRKLYESQEALDLELEPPCDALVITPDLKLALLMLIGHWFINRESTSALSLNDIPMGYEHITGFYRSFSL